MGTQAIGGGREVMRSLSRVFVLSVLVIAVIAPAQTLPDPKPPEPSAIKWGFEQRTRWENWNNILDFNSAHDDSRNQVRFRNRLWVNLPVQSNIDLFVGLANEFKVQTNPDIPTQGDEVIFESLYLDFKKLFTSHLSLRIGRQDLFRGEGFILADGNSGDGSRTGYYNAVDLAFSARKSKLELIGILDPKRDRFLPIIHDQHRYLTEWDEQAIGFYYTDKNLKDTDVESYYFLKKELNDYRAPSNPLFRRNRTFSTFGGRVTQRFQDGFTATGEIARQWGSQHPNTDVSAWAAYGTLKKTFAGNRKPYVTLGYWAMSGDDPATTGKIEGWDPLFSRWPKWGGDLTLYSYIPENGVGYASNDSFSQLEGGFSPLNQLSLRGTWYHHDAFHGTATTGAYRGELLQTRADITLTPNVKGHILYERYYPGDFHATQTPGHFFRMEMIYSFHGSLALKRPH